METDKYDDNRRMIKMMKRKLCCLSKKEPTMEEILIKNSFSLNKNMAPRLARLLSQE